MDSAVFLISAHQEDMKLSTLVQAAVVAIAAVEATRPVPRIHATVHRALKRQGTANLIVTMRDSTTPVLEGVHRRLETLSSRGEMISDMVERLQTYAETSQHEITRLLAQESSVPLASEIRSFWISNQIFLRDATYELVDKLSQMPGVLTIEEERVEELPVMTSANVSAVSSSATRIGVQWGVDRIQAPSVWAEGFNGQGVTVGVIDSGVRVTHEAIRDSFRREKGWYDPQTKSETPYDSDEHGTHVTGTIVGAGGTGVAPGAQWIMCKGCRGRKCLQSDVLQCFQFMMCPTTPSGSGADCSKAPRVVNNSYGGKQGDQSYVASLLAWKSAGIIPIFAIGNSGSLCGTAESPGDSSNVIGVGATDSRDGLAEFSSKGPSIYGKTKPDVSAPGDGVVSASAQADTEYIALSGTSMAAPHVTGLVALLLSSNPTLTFEQVRTRLASTTDQSSLLAADRTCRNSVDGVFPNSMYGHGRVNALSAIRGMRAPPSFPLPGQCDGLDAVTCEGVFFCSWNLLKTRCVRWWS